jgi:hypothetical protein
MESDDLLDQARLLSQRLERLSADSIWARRASGYRASLLKILDEMEKSMGQEQPLMASDQRRLRSLLNGGYRILERAAREYYRTDRIIRRNREEK